MERKKTEVVDGACFGYHDPEFKECLSCKISRACAKATASDRREEVLRAPRDSDEDVRKLVLEWEEEGGSV